MTHSSHSVRERIVYGYAYEVALTSLIVKEKEYLAELDPSDPLFEAKFTPRFSLLTALETYRRELLTGTDWSFPEAEVVDLDALVRERIGGDRNA